MVLSAPGCPMVARRPHGVVCRTTAFFRGPDTTDARETRCGRLERRADTTRGAESEREIDAIERYREESSMRVS